MHDRDARDRVATLESLLEGIEELDDPVARERAFAAVQALVDLYGAGLERVVAVLAERADADELAEALTADELVAHLLLLHDLHPVPIEARVRGALEQVRPYLDSHGGDVELVGVEDGVVRVRLEGSCSGCPSSTVTLKLAIEDAIRKAAPEIETVEADGVDETPKSPLLQIELPMAANGGKGEASRWVSVDDVRALASGTTAVREVAGEPVLFIRLEPSLYAYHADCPSCGESLAVAAVADGCLDCSGCATRYDVRRAGASTRGGEHQLRPLPLLHDDDGAVRVAVEVPA